MRDFSVLATCLAALCAHGSVRTEGGVNTISGGSVSGTADGNLITSRFYQPGGLVTPATDVNTVYIGDTFNHCVRKTIVDPQDRTNTMTSTLAGSCGMPGMNDGILAAARFYLPRGLALDDSTGTIYIADSGNHLIRKLVLSSNDVTTAAGTIAAGTGAHGFVDGPGSSSKFHSPWGLAFSTVTQYPGVLIADRDNHAIRIYNPSTQQMSTLVHSKISPGTTDGTVGSGAQLKYPCDVQGHGTKAYFLQAHAVRTIDSNQVATLVGTGTNGWVDGPTSVARFYDPRGFWVSPEGNVFITDKSHSLIRYFNAAQGEVATILGNGASGPPNFDGTAGNATIDQPEAIWGVHEPNITERFVFADTDHHRIKSATALCLRECQNGGNCTSTNLCTCPPKWTGIDCSIPICNPSCAAYEVCSAPDTCTCPVGYTGANTGANCTTPVCNPTCKNNGTCVAPDVCNCTQGWSDIDCTFAICTIVCYNGGNCTGPNECGCGDDYYGTQCEFPRCNLPCQYNTSCIAPQTCNCTTAPGWRGEGTGYIGADCSIPVCATPCVNGASCVAPDTCACAAGWTGVLCDIPICTTPCQNGGNCTAPDTCECTGTGYDGLYCENPVCASVTCKNNATCTLPNYCDCTGTGYSGSNCTVPVCANPVCGQGLACVAPETCVTQCEQNCTNGGYCIGPNTCQCINGYADFDCSGVYCQQFGCVRGDCLTPDNCTCWYGWEGVSCTVPICNNVTCNNGGVCVSTNLCACVGGFVGPNCLVPLCLRPFRDPSYYLISTSDCEYGVCSSPSNCTCEAGWSGAFCDAPVCELPCLNGGTCIDPDTCDCPEFYGGPTCAEFTKPQLSWMEKNWATLFPIIVVGMIFVGMIILWRARVLKDKLARMAYQLDYNRRHEGNAADYITDTEEEIEEVKIYDDVEPAQNVVNKWAVGATNMREDAKKALRVVNIDTDDESDSTDLSTSVDDGDIPMGDMKRRQSAMTMSMKHADDVDSLTTSSSEDGEGGARRSQAKVVVNRNNITDSEDSSDSD